MWYVMSHHSRDPRKVLQGLAKQGIDAVLSVDKSDWNKKGTMKDMTKHIGVCDNYMNILNYHDSDKWKIILHDDVNIPEGLVENINHILEFAPENPVAFFSFPYQVKQEGKEDSHILDGTYETFATQCHAIPTSMIDGFIQWQKDNVTKYGHLAEDSMLWCWAYYTNTPLYTVLPSLIQHEGWNKTTFHYAAKFQGEYRYAKNYNPNFDVQSVDWQYEFANPIIDRRPIHSFYTQVIRKELLNG